MILKWIVLGVALVVAPQWQMREVHAEDSLTNDEKALLELKEFLDENVEDKRSMDDDDDDDDVCGCDEDDLDCLLTCYQVLCSAACDDNDDCTGDCVGCITECSDDDDDDCPNRCLGQNDKRSLDADLSGADLDKSFQNKLVKKGWFRLPRIPIPRIRIPRIRLPRIPIPRIPLPRIPIPRIRIPRIRIPRIRFPRFGKK